MKKIFVIGDSNTYGWIYGEGCTGGQFPFPVTWPGVMEKALGGTCSVTTDALCGRTTYLEPLRGTTGGAEYIAAITRENKPDAVLIMLGTNDLSADAGVDAEETALNLAALAKAASGASTPAPQILLISPPLLSERSFWTTPRSVEESAKLATCIERAARSVGAYFLDAASVVPLASSEDGVHLSRGDHSALGLAAAEALRALLHVNS